MAWLLFAGYQFYALFSFRLALELFPLLCWITPKGWALLDVAQLPYLSVNRAAVFALSVGAVLRIRQIKRNGRTQPFPMRTAFLALAISFALTLATSAADISSNFATGAALFAEVFLPTYLVYRFCTRDAAEKVIRRLIIFGVAAAVYGTVCYLVEFNPLFSLFQSTLTTGRVVATDYAETVRGLRAVGTFSHPMTYGGFLFITSMLSAAMAARHPRGGKRRLGYNFAALILIAAIPFTNSRTPLIAVLVAAIYVWVVTPLKGKLATVLMAGGGILIFFLLLPQQVDKIAGAFSSLYQLSLEDDQGGSTLGMRLLQLATTWSIFLDNPLFGGGFSFTRSLVASGSYEDLYNTESALYDWALNVGAVGLFAYLFIFLSCHRALRAAFPSLGEGRILRGMLAGYIAFIFATGVMETMQYMLIVVALALRLAPCQGRLDHANRAVMNLPSSKFEGV